MAALGEVPLDRRLGGRDLPLGLGREASAGPMGIGVGLVVADVADGLAGLNGAHAGQRHLPPGPVLLLPVQRRLPAILLDGRPAVGEPEFGTPIAAIGDERQVLGACHRAGGEREAVDERLVARALIVEGELAPLVADLDQPGRIGMPAQRRDRGRRWRRALLVGGAERVAPEDMLDIGEDELLVLLLVVDAQLKEEAIVAPRARCQEVEHPRIDVTAVGVHLLDGGARR